MTAAHYQHTCAAALAAGVVACAAGWLWSHHVHVTGGAAIRSYWIGVAGSAMPALALAACATWLRLERSRGEAEATVRWVTPLFWLCVALLLFMVLFPLM